MIEKTFVFSKSILAKKLFFLGVLSCTVWSYTQTLQAQPAVNPPAPAPSPTAQPPAPAPKAGPPAPANQQLPPPPSSNNNSTWPPPAPAGPAANGPIVPNPKFRDSLCININETSLKAGSEPNQKALWIVNRYMPLKIKSKKPGWIEVEDMDQKTYWVEERLTTMDFGCAVVKSQLVFVRKRADNSPDSLMDLSLDRYTPLKVINQNPDWSEVEDELGESYWIPNSDLWFPGPVIKK